MRYVLNSFRLWSVTLAVGLAGPALSAGPTPTADQALKLAPVQKDVQYDQPAAAEAAKCTIKAEKIGPYTSWVVRDANGQILRQFTDTNKDNVVDRWSYYKDGIEVYRDIDVNFNSKADQYRWLNTAGVRWGLDKNEDGGIDEWKVVSPEEVTAEVVMALRDRDVARFNNLLLTPAELKSLGLGPDKIKEVVGHLQAADKAFAELAKSQKAITAKSEWIHFGGTRPGIVPAGTDGSTNDLVVYENVLGMFDTAGVDGQVQIGTMVKVGDVWRLIMAPRISDPSAQAAESSGVFFKIAAVQPPNSTEAVAGGPSEAVQKLLDELFKLDDAIEQAGSPAEQTKLNDRRADVIEQIAADIGEKDRPQWIRQLADTISAAVQSGTYPEGVARLQSLHEKLDKNLADKDLAAYARFRNLSAEYALSLQGPNPEFVKIQEAWLKSLEDFIADYPGSPDAAEAMLQLAIAEEFAGREEKAKQWYGQIVKNFPDLPSAKKAKGAITRLDSVGKPIALQGKGANGEMVDLAKLRGKHVLLHYWSSQYEPCKADLAQLKELQAKYGKDGFMLIGISLDSDGNALAEFLADNRLPWPQLYEPGGLDSRYANELGILTLPTMILLDDTGKVINRGIHITELDNELKARLKPAGNAAQGNRKSL